MKLVEIIFFLDKQQGQNIITAGKLFENEKPLND